MPVTDHPVSIASKFALFDELWSPKIVGQINDMHLKLVKVEGEFVWHSHPDTDEFFLVHAGRLTIELPEERHVTLEAGDFFVVPRGVRHRAVAAEPCEVLLLEPAGVVNTGDASESDVTAQDEWI